MTQTRKKGAKKPQNKRQLFNSTKGFFVVKKEEKEFEFEGHFLHAKKWILIITIQYSFLIYQLGLWNLTKTWKAEWSNAKMISFQKRSASQNWHQNFSQMYNFKSKIPRTSNFVGCFEVKNLNKRKMLNKYLQSFWNIHKQT